MIQFFIFGASVAYGVGGENGGWADYIKQDLHKRMYSNEGIGDAFELYNFAKPNVTAEFVRMTFKDQMTQYRREGTTVSIVSVGMNNTKAVDEPENITSTLDAFRQELSGLLTDVVAQSDKVFFVGYNYVDESKTYPKISPFSKKKSYFTNARIVEYSAVLRELCKDIGVELIETSASAEDWKEKYLSVDGLHPNDAGHQHIAQGLLKRLEPLLSA